jgi:hypothetical protein
MDFHTATELAKEVEAKDNTLVVAGFRRMRTEDPDSWALDIVNAKTGRMITLDEKDLWPERLREVA